MSDRLTGLDSSFLHLEQDEDTHMHVASTTLFEGPAPGYVEFRDHIESRLHLVPRFRQKVRFVPFGQGRPVWVDDPHFNLTYHVRHTSLPPPGSEEQLKNLAARVFSQQLDRSKPLWEMWLVEGLKDGRFAIVAKTHHCMVDGVSGVDITTVLFDLEKDPPAPPPARGVDPRARAEPRRAAPEALVERLISPREVARGARRLARGPRRMLARPTEAAAAAGSLARAGIGAPSTPFNVDIGGHRRFAMVRASLGRPEAGQERARRHGQRRHPRGRRRAPSGATCAPADTRPRASRCARWSRSASAPRTSAARSATASRG